MESKQNIAGWSIALTFVGTVVGSGFASGQEVLRFFGIYEEQGVYGIFISSVLFFVYGSFVMVIGHRKQWDTYNELFSHLFSRRISFIFDMIFTLFLIGVSAIMVAGSGAVLKNTFQIQPALGSCLTIFLTWLVIIFGLKGITRANQLIVPGLILFILSVSCLTIHFPSSFPTSMPIDPPSPSSWLTSTFFYASYNIGLSLGVLLPVGKKALHPSTCIQGAAGGAMILGILLLGIFFSLQSMSAGSLHAEIPLLATIQQYRLLNLFFSVILWGEIFSTLVSTVFAVRNRITKLISPRFLILFWVVIFLGGQIRFAKLIFVLYPFFGLVCFILLIAITWRIFKKGF
ncbi:hypothetical protein [Candidatus Formimonas warabiya]|uniref:Membrane protein YkvI n=1 Tax=Formimonas warabiya TaxID=1761012 RepID=A0A3G1KZV5_FORW1|nr:hypothetical protein [Candidatus Formimonas warabiya]ATW27919.1 hypothetical protein DCMF_27015 [Candidatus Formimonas warabiya]